MIPASALRKLARLGLSDEQADAIADMLREVEEATDRAANAKIDAREEDRRSRSRGGNAERQRRFRERNGNNGVTQDDNALQPVIQRDEPEPYKDNHARAPVCSNGSSLRSEPVIENKQEKLKPTVLSKKSECLEILLECLSVETATDLISHRKAKKSPMTAGAAKGLVKAFRAFGDTESAARAMMAQGWTGFKPGWMASQPRGSPEKPRNGWLNRMVEGELEHRAKINGNGHELGLHDLEILRNGQEPTMLDGLAFDARDDAAPRGK